MTERTCEEVNPFNGVDLSDPATQALCARLSDLLLEVREEANRTNRLYERTLGLAVIPMLLRRSAGALLVRWRSAKQ